MPRNLEPREEIDRLRKQLEESQDLLRLAAMKVAEMQDARSALQVTVAESKKRRTSKANRTTSKNQGVVPSETSELPMTQKEQEKSARWTGKCGRSRRLLLVNSVQPVAPVRFERLGTHQPGRGNLRNDQWHCPGK